MEVPAFRHPAFGNNYASLLKKQFEELAADTYNLNPNAPEPVRIANTVVYDACKKLLDSLKVKTRPMESAEAHNDRLYRTEEIPLHPSVVHDLTQMMVALRTAKDFASTALLNATKE